MTGKRRMIAWMMAAGILTASLTGCGNTAKPGGESGKDSGKPPDAASVTSSAASETSSDAASEKMPVIEPENEIQSAYVDFMKKRYETDLKNRKFLFRDLDGDGVEELVLDWDLTLTVYRGEEVTELDSYDFVTGTLRLLEPGDGNYPGFICFTVGGGRDRYGYVTLKDDKLKIEDLWTDNFGTEGLDEPYEKYTVISDDEKLVELSKTAYEKEQDVSFHSFEELFAELPWK